MKIRTIEGGVCAAKGFRAAGVPAAIKYKGRNDVALVVADAPCAAAAVFTTNAVAAAPVLYDAPRRRRRPSASTRSSCSWRRPASSDTACPWTVLSPA